MERHAPRGGGNRDEARVALNLTDLELKSVTGKMYCHVLLSEGESGLFAEGAGSTRRCVAGGAFRRPVKREQPSKEVVNELERILQPQERGWQNVLQIFFIPLSRISNAHNSSQRTATSSLGEVVSSIQSYPSPEFLNSLPFIKKFYPTPRWGEGKFIKVTHENSSNLRHSEALQSRKNPAYLLYNTIKLKGIHMNNSTETDHASMPLSIFASKNLAAWLPSRLAAKRVAFTLAEVLITLGIIGVVAALTLPSVVANYKEKQLITAWKKAYSDVANAALLMSQNNEDLSTEQKVGKAFAKYLKVDKVCDANKGIEQGCWRENTKIYSKDGSYAYSDPTDMGGGSVCMILTSGTLFCIDCGGKVSPLFFDINGYLKPNTRGKDVFYALFNRETYMVKPAKGYLQNWGAADCDWMHCTIGDGTCEGDNLGFGCSAEKLLK